MRYCAGEAGRQGTEDGVSSAEILVAKVATSAYFAVSLTPPTLPMFLYRESIGDSNSLTVQSDETANQGPI